MEMIIICLTALVASLLTFFSGFGLGTILTPVFPIFFPVEMAIALTGVVHFLNNLFKLLLVGKHASKQVVIRFGIPAFMAAVGAWLLVRMSDLEPLATYTLGGRGFQITTVGLTIAILIIFFPLMDMVPALRKIEFEKNKLALGGVLSGFFGGLSGNQGALRSAFLIRYGLGKETFIATGVIIACIVDISRLGVYSTRFLKSGLGENVGLVLAATLSAFAGAYLGTRLLKKVTLSAIQIVVMVLLLVLSVGIGLGLI